MTLMTDIFISDLHIGRNKPNNWYQRNVHDPILKSILEHISDKKKNNIRNVIILGDWLDVWNDLPGDDITRLDQIKDANEDIFHRFNDCFNKISGEVFFRNGNHDMTVKGRDIDSEFFSGSRKKISCLKNPLENIVYTSDSRNVYAEHGHKYSHFNNTYLNNKNPYEPLPAGYFITRSAALLIKKELKNQDKENAALLPNSGHPNFRLHDMAINICDLFEIAVGGESVARGVISILTKKFDKNKALKDIEYKMLDNESINAECASCIYPEKFDALEMPIGVDMLNTFYKKDFPPKSWPVSAVANLNPKAKVIIMGHTHQPYWAILPGGDKIYVNAGFLCPDEPSMEEAKIRVNESGIKTLRSEGVAYEILKKLDAMPKDKEFYDEEEFLRALEEDSDGNLLRNNREIILKHVERIPLKEDVFKITEDVLEKLKKTGIPDATADKLSSIIGSEIAGKENFLSSLEEKIGEEAYGYHSIIEKNSIFRRGTKYPTFVEVDEEVDGNASGELKEIRVQKVNYIHDCTIDTMFSACLKNGEWRQYPCS
jgi:UDP-2,3-diacylglucosamine pyrophosphatase LpxH